jgi:hypothetical protein
MKPGKELDAAVAEHVFECDVHEIGDQFYKGHGDVGEYKIYKTYEDDEWLDVPKYSTWIADAWEVATIMRLPFEIARSYKDYNGEGPLGWVSNWCKHGHNGEQCEGVCPEGNSVWALSAPEVICKAALITLNIPS